MNKFDWRYYINKYPELKKEGVNDKVKAINHFKNIGYKEKKCPNKYYESIILDDSEKNFFTNINNKLNMNEKNIEKENINIKSDNEKYLFKREIQDLKKEINNLKLLISNNKRYYDKEIEKLKNTYIDKYSQNTYSDISYSN